MVPIHKCSEWRDSTINIYRTLFGQLDLIHKAAAALSASHAAGVMSTEESFVEIFTCTAKQKNRGEKNLL